MSLYRERDYPSEIAKLRAALEAAERERDDALTDKAHVLENWVPVAERDALKEQVEAAEAPSADTAEMRKTLEFIATWKMTTRSFGDYRDSVGILRDAARACLEEIDSAALARLDQWETE